MSSSVNEDDVKERDEDEERAGRKKRGRPKGSKSKSHKKKPPEDDPSVLSGKDIPGDVSDFLALLPLQAASTISGVARGKRLVFAETNADLVKRSFRRWLDSIEIELTPGWQLALAYSVAFAMAGTEDVDPEEAAADAASGAAAARGAMAAVAQSFTPKGGAETAPPSDTADAA